MIPMGTGGFETGAADVTGNTAGADETGTDTGGPQPVQQACLHEAHEGFFGYRYMCSGQIQAAVSASDMDILQFQNFGEFNDHDSYDNPAPMVMACCPLFDDGDDFCQQPHSKGCTVDLVDTVCASIVVRMQAEAENLGAAAKEQVTELSNWIAAHQVECYQAFLVDTGIVAQDPDCVFDFPEALEGAVWELPNDPKWGAINDPTLTIDFAEINDIFPVATDGVEPLTCESQDENDEVLFVEVDNAGADVMLEGAGVGIQGTFNEDEIQGTTQLASEATNCEGDACSDASFGLPTALGVQLRRMNLEASALATVGGEGSSLVVDDFAIRLYEGQFAHIVGGLPSMEELLEPDCFGAVYKINAGDAFFQTSARAEGSRHVLGVSNATPIFLRRTFLGWRVSRFQLHYTDVAENQWRVLVRPTRWR